MKKSELRQIIQEEIKAVIEAEDVNRTINDKFKAKMGFKAPEGGSGNKMGVTLEELPKFNDLPEEGYDGSISITLPSMKIADAGIIIYSKALAKKWENNFINKWGLAPGEDKIKFSSKNMPLKIVNASDKYNKWKAKEIMTKGAAYDKLGSYKGD